MSSVLPKTFTTRTGQQVIIRTAQPVDAVALLTYIRSVAQETEFFLMEADEFPQSEEQEQKWLQDHLDHPGQIVLLAETDGAIIGNISFESGPQRRTAHRGTLGVSMTKAWRGCGVGRALLEALLAWTTVNPSIEKVSLEVFATNQRAIQLYKSLGFVEEGRHPRHIKFGPERYVDTLTMGWFVK